MEINFYLCQTNNATASALCTAGAIKINNKWENMPIKLMRGFLLVKPEKTREEELQTESGIILVDKDPDRITRGTVVATGDKKFSKDHSTEIPYEVSLGDTVLFKQYGKDRLEYDGIVHRIVTEEDILGILSTPSDGQV